MKLQIFFVFIVIFIAQISYANSQVQDPKLKACAKKVFDQASKVKFNKLPQCFEPKKFNEAKGHLQVVSTFLKQLPPYCRRPTKNTVTKCLQLTEQRLKQQSTTLQASIVKGVNAILQSAQGCVSQVVTQFNGLDKWVLAGCPDKH